MIKSHHANINSVVESKDLGMIIESSTNTPDQMSPQPESEYTKQEILNIESKLIRSKCNYGESCDKDASEYSDTGLCAGHKINWGDALERYTAYTGNSKQACLQDMIKKFPDQVKQANMMPVEKPVEKPAEKPVEKPSEPLFVFTGNSDKPEFKVKEKQISTYSEASYVYKDSIGSLLLLFKSEWFRNAIHIKSVVKYFRDKPFTNLGYELVSYLQLLYRKSANGTFSMSDASHFWNGYDKDQYKFVPNLNERELKQIACKCDPAGYNEWKAKFYPDTVKEPKSSTNKASNDDPIDWPEVSSLIDESSEVPAIFDKRNRSCFEDCTELSKQKIADMPQLIKYLIDNIAYITAGGNGFFQTKRLDEFGNLTYSQVSTNSLKSLLVEFGIMGNDGKVRSRSLFSIACKYIPDLSYGRVDFIPYGCKAEYDWTNRKVFNCFTGFMHDRKPDFQIDHSLIARYLGHIKDVWASGNEDVYQGIIKQFAHYVQKPQVKTQLCLVVLGREGAGKNRPIDLLTSHVLGKQYTFETSKIDTVVGKFNAALENKLLCVLNEASDCSSKESLANQDKLKDIITNQSIVIQKKCIDPYTIADRCNFIAFSNNRYVIKVSEEMRRFAMLEVSDCRMGDHKHFKDMTEDFEVRNAGEHLYHYLMSIDISNYFAQRDFPQTELKSEMRSDAISRDAQWLIAYCNDELLSIYSPSVDKDGFSSSGKLLENLNKWLVSQGYNISNRDKLGRFLKKLGLEDKNKRVGDVRMRGFIINKDDIEKKLKLYFRRDDLFDDQSKDLPADC